MRKNQVAVYDDRAVKAKMMRMAMDKLGPDEVMKRAYAADNDEMCCAALDALGDYLDDRAEMFRAIMNKRLRAARN